MARIHALLMITPDPISADEVMEKLVPELKTFTDTVTGIKKFSRQADKTLEVMIKADENWFFGNLLKLFK